MAENSVHDKYNALAMLYLQSQNLEGKTPAEIHTMYLEAYYEIKRDDQNKLQSGWLAAIRTGDVEQSRT